MLEKKQIQAIFYSSSKWIVKQQRQCTTSTMHLAQELLMNVQCSHGSKRFVKERRALTVRLAIGSWQRQLRAIIETWSSSTTREIAKEVNISHSTVIWHLKQIGKVNKWQVGDSWTDHKSKKKKQNIVLKCLRLLFQTTTMNYFLIRLWHAVKSGFYTTTGDDQLSDWTKKNLQNTSQSEICTNERSSSLVVYHLSDPLQLSESQWNYYIWDACSANQRDALKTASLHLILINRKGLIHLHDNAQRMLSTASKIEQIGLPTKFCLNRPYSPDLSPTDYRFFNHFNKILQGKRFHNQQETENAFQGFPKSRSMNFYVTGINKLISCGQKCIDCNDSYFD